jgi:outer membrane receptor protein involved in Fe transport
MDYKKKLIGVFISVFFLGNFIFAQQHGQDSLSVDKLFSMSLEELMNVKVTTGTLTEMTRSKIPVSVTVISHEDIEICPARNLFDLIEVYVPSATFVNHWQGPRLGVDGVLGDQNSSYLVIVNGVKINTSYQGMALTEIQNKDLGDIEKIEIIRGPGSVTYGAGAIGGVINIVTKNATTSEGLNVALDGDFKYRYGTGSVSYGLNTEKFKAFLYGSYSFSEGIKDPGFYYVDRTHGYGYGFMSPTWGNKGLGSDAPNFYENYWGKPEIKLNLDIEMYKEFRLWARFTSYSFTKQQQAYETADGSDLPGLFGKQFAAVLENNHRFSNSFKLKSSFGFSSQSHRDVTFYQGDKKPSDHITQRNYSYSESEYFLKSQLNYKLKDKFRFALGGEYQFEYFGPEWGMKDNTFILPFQAPIRFAVYDTTSGFYQEYGKDFCTYIDKTITSNSVSAFFEASLDISDKNTLMVSGRADKHKYSQWAYSPRVAWIFELDGKNTFKTVYQHSVRLPAFIDLYSQHELSGTFPKPEVLKGIDLIYSRMQTENLYFKFSSYFHSIDQIAWLPTGRSGLVGTFELFGFDLEANYANKNTKLGGSYSFIHQMSWHPEVEVDAFVDIDLSPLLTYEIHFVNYAQNRINNMPVHSVKFFWDQNLTADLLIHFDCRMNFNYQQKEMLDMFKAVHDKFGSPESRQEMDAIYDDLYDHGYGRNSFTSNVSINWKVPIEVIDAKVSVYAMNIVSVNHIRYVMQYWEGGNLRQYPRQCGFVKEPTTFGVKIRLHF